MLRKYEYLLIGSAAIFKSAMQLRRPLRAGLITETYWNNRVTPLPPGIHLLLRQEADGSSQWQLQQPLAPTVSLALGDEISTDISDSALSQAEQMGLPPLQPAASSGLVADTRLQAYEEVYRQDKTDFIFAQGIVHFAQDFEKRWVFIGSDPQVTHLTVVTAEPGLPPRLHRALIAAAALPTIAPAQHAQQLTRMQSWWWGGQRPVNHPVEDQLPEMVELEIESKLSVAGDFSATSWQLSDCLRTGAIDGFTLHSDDLLVRHTHDVVRYLKGRHKLILQGAAYRFGQKSLKYAQTIPPGQAADHPPMEVMIRHEIKPGYSPVENLDTANAIQTRIQERKLVGDLYCHKRKYMVESAATGGGYHVLIDFSRVLARPEEVFAQIEVECQWKKIPPRQTYADPVGVAVEEIQRITQSLCNCLPGVAPTHLTKRKWLKRSLSTSKKRASLGSHNLDVISDEGSHPRPRRSPRKASTMDRVPARVGDIHPLIPG
ncbi:MAG: hypothetical protein KBG20_00245 [Caldilineaceae bacterium]|nr:hypothetical protein [Caldilineaceae bacterium]MBP8107220.1 hypothetical protein [Caldilineaceae bacterium]MBP8121382.1 hypothetical protein [Caldilineaceae bacterium]MBP9070687.1 hypothetical protein [Caldilineaceae bacterium]